MACVRARRTGAACVSRSTHLAGGVAGGTRGDDRFQRKNGCAARWLIARTRLAARGRPGGIADISGAGVREAAISSSSGMWGLGVLACPGPPHKQPSVAIGIV